MKTFFAALLALCAFAMAAVQGYYMHTFTGELVGPHYVVLGMLLVCGTAMLVATVTLMHENYCDALRVRSGR